MQRNSPEQEWEAIGNEIDRRTKREWGGRIDAGIRAATIAIKAMLGREGGDTVMSCEGHPDEVQPIAWVNFDTAPDPPVRRRQLGRIGRALDQFYEDRRHDADMRLGVYNDIGGEESGEHTLTTTYGHELWRSGSRDRQAEAVAKLPEQQQEMDGFASFVREGFFARHEAEDKPEPEKSWWDR